MRVAVCRSGSLAAYVRQAIVDQVRDEIVDHSVVAFAAFLAGRDELEVPEEGELVAHGRHRQAEGVCQVADAKLVVRERVNDPKPQGVREREEDLYRLGRRVGSWKRPPDSLQSRCVRDLGEPCLHS